MPRMGFPTQSPESTHHVGSGRHLWWESGLSPPCSSQMLPGLTSLPAVEPHRRVACGGVCRMEPACAFGESSRFHLQDKKGRHEGNDIYVLGKPSCSELPQRRERGRGRLLPAASRLGSICWAASLAAGPAPSQCPGPPPPPSASRWKYQPACSQKWGKETSVWKGRGAEVHSWGSAGNSPWITSHPELGRGQAWGLWGAVDPSSLFIHRLPH